MENKLTWKQRLSTFFIKNAPPGMNTERLTGEYLRGLAAMFVLSFFHFFGNYRRAYGALFMLTTGNKKVLRPGAVMQNFVEILENDLQTFYVYCIFLLAVVIRNYLYYYQGSKSIYLMRRLPNRMELHRRAWVLPLLAIAATLFFTFVVLVFYFEVYMIVTPGECITPGQWQNIWR